MGSVHDLSSATVGFVLVLLLIGLRAARVLVVGVGVLAGALLLS